MKSSSLLLDFKKQKTRYSSSKGALVALSRGVCESIGACAAGGGGSGLGEEFDEEAETARDIFHDEL